MKGKRAPRPASRRKVAEQEIATASPASVFHDRPVEALVTLPVPIRGQRAVVRIRMVDQPALLVATDGIPDVARAPANPKGNRAEAAAAKAMVGPMREVARLGIVSPAFSFDAPEKGKPFWGALAWTNQIAIVNGIMSLSGVEGVPDEFLSFPDDESEWAADRRRDRDAGAAEGTVADRGDGAADRGASAQRSVPARRAPGAPGVRCTSKARRSGG